MFRRLRLPLPLTERVCRCRRNLDPLGDHRAACARAGVLRSRGVPLVCREAGARVTMHTRLANLNIPAVQRIDDRTIEVIANGLPLWHGSQLAIDTTLVPPLTAAGEPRRRGGRYAAAALHTARQNKQRTYPELLASARCWLVVMGMEVGGRWSQESAEFLRLLAQQSPISSCPITTSHSHLAHQPLVSHPRPRRHARLRGFFALVAGGWTGQRRGGSATPRATPRPTRSHPHQPQSTSREVRARNLWLSPLVCSFGFRSWTLPLDFAGLNHRNFGGPTADRKKVPEKKIAPRFGCVLRTQHVADFWFRSWTNWNQGYFQSSAAGLEMVHVNNFPVSTSTCSKC